MKTVISLVLSLVSFSLLSSCTTVERVEPAVPTVTQTTTTTERTSGAKPLSKITETQTIRSY